MTGIMKAQIDWVPLKVGAVRPTQGKTLAVMQVERGIPILQCGEPIKSIGTLDAHDYHT